MKVYKKRLFIRIFFVCICIFAGLLLSVYAWYFSIHKPVLIKKDGFLFDTYVSVTTNLKADTCESVNDTVFEMLNDYDEHFKKSYQKNAKQLEGDYFLTDCLKETSLLNEKYGDRINLSCGELTSLWGISTDNPRVPTKSEIERTMMSVDDTKYHDGDFSAFMDNTKLDFGAVAKGKALDDVFVNIDFKLQNINRTKDFNYIIVSLGSSTLFYGQKPDGSKFRTAIRNPFSNENYLGFVETDAAFISTSGGYERFFEADGIKYEHILDIETGYPAKTDFVSVTVIVPIKSESDYGGGIMSDFLSTLIYIDGTKEIEKYLDNSDFYVIAVDNLNNIYLSKNMPEGMFTDQICPVN